MNNTNLLRQQRPAITRLELQRKYLHHRTGKMAISGLMFRHRTYETLRGPRINERMRYSAFGGEAERRQRGTQQVDHSSAKQGGSPPHPSATIIDTHITGGVGYCNTRKSLQRKLNTLLQALEEKPRKSDWRPASILLEECPEAARKSRIERRERLKSLATQHIIETHARGEGGIQRWGTAFKLADDILRGEGSAADKVSRLMTWQMPPQLPECRGPCGRVAQSIFVGLLMPVADRLDGGFNRVNGDLAGVAARIDGYLGVVEGKLDPNFKYHEAARLAAAIEGNDAVVERWRPSNEREVQGRALQGRSSSLEIERSSRRTASSREGRRTGAPSSCSYSSNSRRKERTKGKAGIRARLACRLSSAGDSIATAAQKAWTSATAPARIVHNRLSPQVLHDTLLGGLRESSLLSRPSLMIIRVSRRVFGALAQDGPLNVVALYQSLWAAPGGSSNGMPPFRGEIVKFIPAPSTLSVSRSLRSLLSAGTGGLGGPDDDSDEDNDDGNSTSGSRSRWIANAEELNRELDRRMEDLASKDSMSIRRTSFGYTTALPTAVVVQRDRRKSNGSSGRARCSNDEVVESDGESSGQEAEERVRPGHRRRRIAKEEKRVKKHRARHPAGVPRQDAEFTERLSCHILSTPLSLVFFNGQNVRKYLPAIMALDAHHIGHQPHHSIASTFASSTMCHHNDPLSTAFGIKRIYFAANNKDWKLDCNSGDEQDCISECQREFKGDALATHECVASVQRAYSMMPGGGGRMPTCFPVTSRAFVQGRGWTPLCDIDVGDCVLTSSSASQEPHFEPIVGWLHYEPPSPKRRHRFLRLTTASSGDLYLSPEHLVPTNLGYLPAKQVSCTATTVFKLSALDHQLLNYKVQSVQAIELSDSGLACPLLPSGHVIIEGVLCSCYSPPWGMSHEAVHALAAPFRNGVLPLPPKNAGGAFVHYRSLKHIVGLFT
ncbi:hypothetical protein FOL47_000022 [Perkinsus chesapeaki]|uniref:Hedgehog protein Hint domain-containing protein n=1 Tax=Perkinsus chesapeaki TaxID=330153 RepID=A0A7J6N345_PERCH|nr:hypothetical protein FOL47_000022 [Perkinsus chesapeaki]